MSNSWKGIWIKKDTEMSFGEKAMLETLTSMCKFGERTTKITNKGLSESIGTSERTVGRIYSKLVKSGYISSTVTTRATVHTLYTKQRTTSLTARTIGRCDRVSATEGVKKAHTGEVITPGDYNYKGKHIVVYGYNPDGRLKYEDMSSHRIDTRSFKKIDNLGGSNE